MAFRALLLLMTSVSICSLRERWQLCKGPSRFVRIHHRHRKPHMNQNVISHDSFWRVVQADFSANVAESYGAAAQTKILLLEDGQDFAGYCQTHVRTSAFQLSNEQSLTQGTPWPIAGRYFSEANRCATNLGFTVKPPEIWLDRRMPARAIDAAIHQQACDFIDSSRGDK